MRGPEGYTPRYPGATEPGIDDNAYTNVMAVWLLLRAQDVLAVLPSTRRTELIESLGLGPAELLHWRQISLRMYVPIGADGVISQFEGYRDLPELDWDDYRRRYRDIQRLDRILEAEGRSVDDYQASTHAHALGRVYRRARGPAGCRAREARDRARVRGVRAPRRAARRRCVQRRNDDSRGRSPSNERRTVASRVKARKPTALRRSACVRR